MDVHPDGERIGILSDEEARRGDYVLYWMQNSHRAGDNPALEFAVRRANDLGLPVAVVFGMTPGYPDANLRHYAFMLQGLAEAQQTLRERGIPMSVVHGDPVEVALWAAKRAAEVVCDRGYMRLQVAWRRMVAGQAGRRTWQVEGDVVVPVEAVSGKAEYAARTIRPKIHRLLSDFTMPPEAVEPANPATDTGIPGMDLSDPVAAAKKIGVSDDAGPVNRFFRGGASEALRRFEDFLRNRAASYVDNGKRPETDNVSMMGPYLHFGQVSPVRLLRMVADSGLPADVRDGFIEQLVVRRELAVNHVYHTPDYDSYEALPEWARKTLDEHRDDPREYVYDLEQLESRQTHDPYWNAAMLEMQATGYMHNYMRMYWGKKILEWSGSPEEGFANTLLLNNRYFLDGRDPNSCTGVAWCYGLHDRAWTERPVFGKIRYMNARGLERKSDPGAYVEKVGRLAREAGMPQQD
ncbi:MAG: deoxyribodipyrimidine photo-lyase [Desulfatibacillaceae bacterium]